MSRRSPFIRAVAALLCASLAASSVEAGAAPARAALLPPRAAAPAPLPQLAPDALASGALSTLSAAPSFVLQAPLTAPAVSVALPALGALLDAPAARLPDAAGPTAAPAAAAVLEETARSLSEPGGAPRGDDARLTLSRTFDATPRRSDAASPVSAAWSSPRRWTRAAALGAALTFSAAPGAVAQEAAPASGGVVVPAPAQKAAPAPAKAAPVTATARPRASAYTPGDPIQVDIHLRNDGAAAVVFPGDALLEELRKRAGPGYTVTMPDYRGGGVLIQPGTTARVLVELEAVGLPPGLERGQSLPVRVGPTKVDAAGVEIEVPGFDFKMKSAHDAKEPPKGLYEAKPWSERYFLDWFLLGVWVGTAGTAWLAWRLYKAWKKRRLLSLPLPPAAPDPGEVAREALDGLAAAAAAGLPAEEQYRRLVIIVNYFVGRLYGLDAEYSEDLSTAARTLRGMIERVDAPPVAAKAAADDRESAYLRRHRLVTEALAADRELIANSVRHWHRVLDPFERAAASGSKTAGKRAAKMRERMGRHLAGLEERHGFLKAELEERMTAGRGDIEKVLRKRLLELTRARDSYVERLAPARKGALPEPARAALDELAGSVSRVLYAGVEGADPAQDRERARRVVDELAPRRAGAMPASGQASGFTVMGVTYGAPLWFAALIPAAALLGWKWWRSRKGVPAAAAPSSAFLARRPGLRRLLDWVPRALQAAALVLTIGALADPQWGYRRGQAVVTSLDNLIVVDRSGSMGGPMPGTQDRSKMDAAKEAARQFVEKQRGTTNRLGLVVFDDRSRLVMSLTLDYEALLAGFAQVQAGGGTNIPLSIETALQHFVENAIVDLDVRSVSGAAAVRDALKSRGLSAALEEARKHPRVLDAILAKERHKAVIFLSDGVGGNPIEAVRRAKELGIRIFAIGVPGDSDQRVLEMMATETGGRFFWVHDKNALDAAFAEIDKLEKAWVNVTSPPRPIHHDHEYAAWALGLLLLSLLLQAGPARLGRIPSRGAFAVAPLALMLTAGQPLPLPFFAQVPAQQAAAPAAPRGSLLDYFPYREVPEIRDAIRLLESGKEKEALERFDEAARLHPGYPEVDLYRSMLQRRLQLPAAAERSLERAVKAARDQGRGDVLAAAQLELGNAAAQAGDREAALKHYRNALRVPDADGYAANNRLKTLRDAARANYETLLRQPPAPKDGDGKGEPKDGKGEPKDGKGEPKGGDGKPQDGKAPSKDGKQPGKARPGEGALRELEQRSKPGPGGGYGERAPGQAWGFAPLLAFSDLSVVWNLPDFLVWTALALPVLGVLLYLRLRAHHRGVKAVAPASTPASALSWMPGRAYLRRTALALAAAVMLALGAAAPSLGTKERSFSFGGKDVVVLQDVSLSVLWAEDERFAESTAGIERFLKWLENGSATDRVAIVPFAGRPGEATLSDDYKNALFQLYHLGQDAIYLPEGSDLSQGVYGAVRTFAAARDMGARQRVLIVLSDGGEDQRQLLDEAIAEAKKHGITIYAIGLGRENARLRVPPEHRPKLGEYLRNGSVRVGSDPAALERLARETGGLYLRASGEGGMDQVLARITEHAQAQGAGSAKVENGVAHWFLAPGALLLLLAMLAGDGTRSRRREAPAPKQDETTKLGGLIPGLAFTLPSFSLGPVIGLWPALAAGGVVLALALLAGWLSLRPSSADAKKPEPASRRGEVERAGSAVQWDKLLKGEFRSPDAVRFGADPDDAVPHTDEPWRQVDHRVSARTGVLHAKRFEEDPDIPLMLVVDVSRSGLQGSSGMTKRDVAAELAGAMALAGAREDMLVGAVLFSDRVEKIIPPRRGAAHARRLYTAIQEFVPEGRATDIGAGLREALARAPKRGVVAAISDFDGDGYQSALAAAARRHVLVPVVIEDVLERDVPKGVRGVEIEDPETGARSVLDTSGRARDAVAASIAARRRRLASSLGSGAARPLYVVNDGKHLTRLMAYFRNGGRIDEPK